MNIQVPISLGELYDKFSILEIKKEKIKDNNKLQNIEKEYNELNKIIKTLNFDKELYYKLKNVNLKLWDIEDKIRIKEKNKEFDNEFIKIVRNVYYTNDERSKIKNQINLKYNSNFIEEKSYEKYN